RHGQVTEVDAVDLDAELTREQERSRARSAGDVKHVVTRPQLEGPGEAARQIEPTGVVAVAEDERNRVALVRARAAELERLGRGHRLRRAHRRFLPTFVASAGTWSDPSAAPLPLASPSASSLPCVFEPYFVVRSTGCSSSAFGTIVGTETPDSCSRTSSRYPTELYAQKGMTRPAGALS